MVNFKRLLIVLAVMAVCGPVRAKSRNYEAGEYTAPLNGHVLGPKEYVEGTANTVTLTCLANQPGPVITSKNYDKLRAANAGRWDHEGANVRNYVAKLTINANGAAPLYAHDWERNGWQLPAEKPWAVVQLWCAAPTLERLHVFGHPGVAYRLGCGSTPLGGRQTEDDREQATVSGLSSNQCYSGLDIESGADGNYDNLDFYNGLCFGVRCSGAANSLSRIHCAGFLGKPTSLDPDRGVGFINGPHANYWGEGIQADYCRVGFRNYGPGTTLTHFISKYGTDVGIDALQSMTVEDFDIERAGGINNGKSPFNPAYVAAEIVAPGTVIKGGTWSAGQAYKFTGPRVKASRCHVSNSPDSWFCMFSESTVIEFGSPTEKLFGCTIDVWASGAGCGIKLTHEIGKGNTFIVHHNGNCDTPIDVGPNKDLAGNTVRIENALSGE